MKNKPAQGIVSLTKLPPFWDHRVIFMSNIFSIFFDNHAQIEELHREVGALTTYGGRMLPILDILFKKKGNLIALERHPDENLISYFRDLGLSIPEIIILPDDFYQRLKNKDKSLEDFTDQLKKHPAKDMIGYVIDEALETLAGAIHKNVVGSKQGSQHGNNKRLLHNFLLQNNLPTFDSLEAKDMSEITKGLQVLTEKGYRNAVIKSQIGASGIGMRKMEIANNSVDSLPPYLFHEGPVLVQGWLDEHIPSLRTISSPSILLFVDEDDFWLYDLTDQILNPNSIHEGNISPASFLHEYPEAKDILIAQAQKVAVWLKAQGYRGTASIDFLVFEKKGVLEARVCEINARVTGATYPAILAKHFLPNHTWLLRNIRFSPPLTSHDLLSQLKGANLLFQKGKQSGVLPFNFNTDEEGKIFKAQFLFLAENKANVYTLIEEVTNKISTPGAFDRD